MSNFYTKQFILHSFERKLRQCSVTILENKSVKLLQYTPVKNVARRQVAERIILHSIHYIIITKTIARWKTP